MNGLKKMVFNIETQVHIRTWVSMCLLMKHSYLYTVPFINLKFINDMGKIITEIEAYSISGYGKIDEENKCCTRAKLDDFFLKARGYQQNQLVDTADIELNVITFDIDVSMSNRAGNKNWEFNIHNYRGPLPTENIILETQCPLYPSGKVTLNITPDDAERILNNGFISFREYYYYDYYKTNIPAYVVNYNAQTEIGLTPVFAKFNEYKYTEDPVDIGKLTFVVTSSRNANYLRFWIENPTYEIISHTEYIYINNGKGTQTYDAFPPSLYLGNGYSGVAIDYNTFYNLYYEFTDLDGTKRNGHITFSMRQQSENVVRISE